MNSVLLRADNISKSFGGVQALKDVSLTLNKGDLQTVFLIFLANKMMDI